jgi:acyl-Coa thioesterase superfamily protein
VTASLTHGGRVVASARAWQVADGRVPDAARRPAAEPAGPHAPPDGPHPPAGAGPDTPSAAPPPLPQESSYGRASFAFGFQEAVEMRFVRGSFRERAPATAWARLLVPLLPGAACTPLQRVAALADFGTGISAVLDRAAWSYHNLDLSVHLHRRPSGDWICLDAVTLVGPEGTGTCLTTLHDQAGPVGSAAQSLLITAAGQP